MQKIQTHCHRMAGNIGENYIWRSSALSKFNVGGKRDAKINNIGA